MYEAFFGLSKDPFRLMPDPRLCFPHRSFARVWSHLGNALQRGEGIVVVTGPPGSGKTTLAGRLLDELDPTETVGVHLIANYLDPTEMLRRLAFSLGLPAEGLDRATLAHHIEGYLVGLEHANRRAVVVIDEAQTLPHPSLEAMRLLCDLQSRTRPVLQLVLLGQEELEGALCTLGMQQFQHRVIATCRLHAMDLAETKAYMEYRLGHADWRGDPSINGPAVLSIFEQSKGIPRLVNKLCSRLLLYGSAEGRHALNERDVWTVAREVRQEWLAPPDTDLWLSHAKSTGLFDPAYELALVPVARSAQYEMAGLHLHDEIPAAGPAAAVRGVTASVGKPAEPAVPAPVRRVPDQPPALRRHAALAAGLGLLAVAAVAWVVGDRDARIGHGAEATAVAVRPVIDPPASGDAPPIGPLVVADLPGSMPTATATATATATPAPTPTPTPTLALTTTLGEESADPPGADRPVPTVSRAPPRLFDDQYRHVLAVPQQAASPGRHDPQFEVGGALSDRLFASLAPEVSGREFVAAVQRESGLGIGAMAADVKAILSGGNTGVPRSGGAAVPEAVVAEVRGVAGDTPEDAPDGPLPRPDEGLGPQDEGREEGALVTAIRPDEGYGPQDESGQGGALVTLIRPDEGHEPQAEGREEGALVTAIRPDEGYGPQDESGQGGALVTLIRPDGGHEPQAEDQAGGGDAAVDHRIAVSDDQGAEVRRLNALAGRALANNRLLLPTGDSAYTYYRQVLAIDGGNREARAGFARIVERYGALANRALAQGDFDGANRFIERALRVDPRHAATLALRGRVALAIAQADAARLKALELSRTAAASESDVAKPAPRKTDSFRRLMGLVDGHDFENAQ